MSSLEQFLKTGKLGKLELGISILEVQNIITDTECMSEITEDATFLKYDNLIIKLEEDRVTKIEIRYFTLEEGDLPTLPHGLIDESWLLTISTSLEELVELFNYYQLLWGIDRRVSVGTYLCFIVENKINVCYDFDYFEFCGFIVRDYSRLELLSVPIL